MSGTENEIKVENVNKEEKTEVSPTSNPVQVRETKDNVSVCSSDVVSHSRGERPGSILSATITPSFHVTHREANSTTNLQTGVPSKNGIKKSDSTVLQLILPRNNTYPNTPIGNGSFFGVSAQNSLDVKVPQTPLSQGSEALGSVISIPHADTPTPPEKKKEAFSDILVNTCSLFYALFNVTVGLALIVADVIDGSHEQSEMFSLLLVSISCIFISYLIADISWFAYKQQKLQQEIDKRMADNNVDVTELPGGDFQYNFIIPDVVMLKNKLRHDYCFNYDRHSTNFYLKIGAAAFCLGHLIHLGLSAGYQLVYLFSDDAEIYDCVSDYLVAINFVYPFYSFLMLFFIFKYSNVIINKSTVLCRFGIMHCLSSSICFWLWTIAREVLEALSSKETSTETTTTNSVEDPVMTFRRFTQVCDYSGTWKNIFNIFSPYLYPFSVEFSILIVGVLYLVWSNIKKCHSENDSEDNSTLKCKKPIENIDNGRGNTVIYANCHASNKGLFGGFAILLLTIISCILFFSFIYASTENSENGLMVNRITAIIILSTMLIASLVAYKQITKLDLNSVHHNLLDDILLFICIPAFFLNGIFTIIPAIVNINVWMLVSIPLEIVQVLVQTVFMLDGVRRSSNTKRLRMIKPGRELVTFLIIANVSLWLFSTFEVKAHGLEDHRYDYFGKELWTILGHMCLPLMMFYRFHSSVCLCDIWKFAYEPSGH
ncbi:proton channel OtopLc-like [Diorhabda sublineata]|uniref:proton channel OtopLc-like n=1 Tax=Diorhabda sublineata TaxID=1163346 RepID=UPI0024E12A78|nr:proton channel OtopLc-like [Diorhabda sublineata]